MRFGFNLSLIFILVSITSLNVKAQIISADFTLSADTICLEQNFSVVSNSADSEKVIWDFCLEDLEGVPASENLLSLTDVNIPNSIKVIYDSLNWYGFVSSRGNNKLFRLDFGNNLSNTPAIVDLGNIGNELNAPKDIEFFQENGEWYALLINVGNDHIVRLHFPSGLTSQPIADDLGEIGSWNILRGLDIAVDDNQIVVIVSSYNSNTLSLINFQNSITNNPTSSDVVTFGSGVLSRPIGVKLIEENGNWYGMVASYNNNKVFKLAFGADLFTTPTISSLGDISLPTECFLVKEGNKTFGFVTGRNSGLVHFNFDSSISDENFSVDHLGTLGLLNDVFAFTMVKETPDWYAFAINSSAKLLSRLSFANNCTSATFQSSDKTSVDNLSYNIAGVHGISLTAYDEFGNRDDITQFITVTEDQAPVIEIQLSSQCIGNTSTITASADQSFTSTNWIINGDARTGEITTYDFPAPGTYEVTLEVESENGCGQRVTQEITIYDPPNPNFSLPAGQICTNGAVSLTNLTNAQGADSLITYQWFVDDELVSEVENPDIVFAEGGNKTLRLDASIPGCTETYETTVNVAQGPTVAFTLPPQLCAGEVITLENQTSGDNITGYQWSFGDGGTLETTSAETITYTFPESGIYDISLTANTSLGCANVMSQTVTVFEQPTVGFSSDVACVGAITQFTDTTTAGNNANIVAWQWDFGDGVGTSDIRNPNYTFTNPGTYTVELTTQSSGGCAASATQTITVETSVTPGFTATRVCPNSTDPILYQFADTSTVADGDQITQWLWTINGENFVEESVTYAFTEPGTYDVSLTTFASSGCNATFSQSLVVNKLPVVQFEAASGCVDEALMLRNETQLNGWDLKQYMWQVPTVGSVFEQSPSVVFSEAGEYPITLTVETADGCTFSFDSTLTILESPVAAFDVPQLSGGAPLIVNTMNLSSGYTQSLWEINGEVVSEEDAPVFTLDALGTYEIALIVQNAIGCADTTRKIIEVVNPTLDIVLEELTVVEGAAQPGQLVLLVRNQGTLAVDAINVLVTLGDVVSLNEQIEGPLLPGERLSYPLQTSLSAVRNQQHPVDYICISATIDTVKSEMAEVSLDNNRVCITLNAPLLVEAPFPNPAREAVALSILLEAPGEIRVKLISATGELMSSQLISEAHQGLNSFSLDVSQTPSGVYTVEVSALGQKVVRRIIVNP